MSDYPSDPYDLLEGLGDTLPALARVMEDLNLADRCAMRRQYRDLRIAIYAPQSYTGPDRESYQGCYGMSRERAKEFLIRFYREVAWHQYLGSK